MAETSGSTLGPRSAAELLALRARIRGEFLEMPGLVLTQEQAMRMFCLGPECCHEILADLVSTGFLGTDGRRFLRAD